MMQVLSDNIPHLRIASSYLNADEMLHEQHIES